MAPSAGFLTDLPDPRDDREADGPDYPEGQGQDLTLSRDAQHATYEPGYTPPDNPPPGSATWQSLNPPSGGEE